MESNKDSDLKEEQSTTPSEGNESKHNLSVDRLITSEIRKLLAIDNEKGNINLKKSELEAFFGGYRVKVEIKDGEMTYYSMEPYHVAMIWESAATSLPNGYLVSKGVGKELSMEWVPDLPESENNQLVLPKINYDEDAWEVSLMDASLINFIDCISDSKINYVYFDLEGDETSASVKIYGKNEDEDTNGGVDCSLHVLAKSNHKKKELSEGQNDAGRVVFDREFLEKTVRAMLGNKIFRNPRFNFLTLKLKDKYPMSLYTLRTVPDIGRVKVNAAIAPVVK
jgi:hypothetical protein